MTASGVQCTLVGWGQERLRGGDSGGGGSESLGAAETGTLDCKSLAHDRAAASQNLEVGHSSTAGAGTGSRGEGAEGGGRGALEEGAHSPGLLKHGLHDDDRIEAKQGV